MPSDDALLKTIWEYMTVSEPLVKADAIVAGGCKDMFVAKRAAELYLEGWAPLIIVTGYQQAGLPKTEADLFAEIAIAEGVPDSAILREPFARNTGQNIVYSQALLIAHGINPTAIILVHKPYMSRRFLATAEVQWGGRLPHFIPQHEIIPFEAYMKREGRQEVTHRLLGDFSRMERYAKTGFQSRQVIPAVVQFAFDTLVERGYTTR